MVFSTPVFMFGFLILTLLVYYVMPLKWRNAVLLCSSLFFYYWGEQKYTIIMVLSTLIDFSHGWLVDYFKKKNLAEVLLEENLTTASLLNSLENIT